MAQIIPEDSLTASYPGPELHGCLNQLSTEYKVWQQLSSDMDATGLRYCLTYQKKSVLIATLPTNALVSESSVNQQTLQCHPLVFELTQERNALLPELLSEHAHQLLPIILLLPDNLGEKQTIYLKRHGLLAIGSIFLDGAMPIVLSKCLGLSASTQVMNIIHKRFNPALSATYPSSETTTKSNTPTLLDYEQARALTIDLDTHKSSKQPFSLRYILGIAGSGKSLVLAKRAALLAGQHPNAKVLVLSHNKALSNQLKKQIGNFNNIHCHPFMEWCRKLLGGTRQFVYEDQETELFDLMIKRHFEDLDLSRYGLIREINFIKDRMISTEADYLNTLRSNQSLALSNPVRKRIWQAMVQINTHLKDRNCHLWADAPAILLQAFDEGKTFEPYQYVLIDEAQYFAPAWIKVIRRAMATHSQLFLASDPDQGFYNRNLHWKETGLDFRGRTIRLNNNYRCSPAITRVVDAFRLHRLMEPSDHPLYSINHMEPIRPEEHPQLLHFPTKEDQKNRLFSEINQLLKRGYTPSDILVLNADKQSTRFMAQDIRKALKINTTTLTGSMVINDDSLKLCDLESATGLESRAVFITGLEQVLKPEADRTISDRERHSLKNSNTRLLCMAMTRASEQLYLLLTSQRIPDEFIIEGLDVPTYSSAHRAPVMYINQ